MQPVEHDPPTNTRLHVGILLLVTVLVYSPVLFSFFLGDDFVHLSWLSKASADPTLLLRNFNHNWLDVVTAKFYRPLISIFMFIDYMIWRTNGLGFHITNLFFHVINTLLVFFIGRILTVVGKKRTDPAPLALEKAVSWPFVGALLFAIYPLHPEAVSWITGRVDSIVTTFYLASLFNFIVWSITRTKLYLVISLVSACLSLLSKEMAATLPLAMAIFSYWLSSSSVMPKKPMGKAIAAAIKDTAPFWLLLILYIAIRALSLGTLVGGYDDSLFFVADWHRLLSTWLHAARMILIPINRNVIGDKNIFTIIWSLCLLQAFCGLLLGLFSKTSRSVALLLTALTVISLLPVYKILAIDNDLEGSRLAYLTSCFLCMLLGLGICEMFRLLPTIAENTRGRILALVLALWCCSGFYLLYRNNMQWIDAGAECNAIRRQLAQLYDQTKTSDHLLLVGLPDQINGAYVCRNVSPGIVEAPQFAKAARDCLMLNTYDPVFPFGYLKNSLASAAGAVKIFWWNSTSKQFVSVSPMTASKVELAPARFPCWSTDFVRSSASKNEAPRLQFKNDLTTANHVETRIDGHPLSTGTGTGIIYALRPSPLWACGGQFGSLTYSTTGKKQDSDSYANSNSLSSSGATTTSMQTVAPNAIMPIIDFDNSGYLGSRGFLHLSKSHPSGEIRCVENNVEGADHFVLEILRPNVFLAPFEQNATEESKQQLKKVSASEKTGKIQISLDNLSGEGLYQARLWSADRQGNTLGAAGDHIIISVDSH